MKDCLFKNCIDTLRKAKAIKVENCVGFWSVIDYSHGYVMLEHNTFGDETEYLVIKATEFVMKNFTNKITGETHSRPFFPSSVPYYETFDGIGEALEDYELI